MPHRSLVVLVLVAAASLSACASQTRMPAREQARVQEQTVHRTRQLAVGMYVAPFFRDARYRLLSDQPPQDVDLLRGPTGARIEPGPATGILPAGTEVRIRDVEFPTATVTTSRTLVTPRHFTWVFVDVPGAERPHVLVLRDDPADHQAFLELLGRYLTEEDVAARVRAYPESVASAIREKRLVEGMDAQAARLAWGWPIELDQRFEGGVRVQTWRFEGGRTLTLRDDRLVSWSDPAAPGSGG